MTLFAKLCFTQKLAEPFPTRNQSPLIHFFGLPFNSGGTLLEQNELIFGNFLNIANNATSAKAGREAIYLDGEMYRNDIILRYGISKGWEIALNIPIVRHSGGVMDSFIDRWHETFRLPGKARETMTNYSLTYVYFDDDETVLFMNHKKLEIGDIAFSLSKSLTNNENHKLALKAFVKSSTGKKSFLIGSGTNDYGFQFTGSIYPTARQKKFSWFYSAGYLKIGHGAILADQISKNVIFGNFGGAYYLSSKWIPKVQLDFHSGFYRNSITKQLGKESVQLIIGTDYMIAKNLNLSASFTEDLLVNTAPDFVIQFGISYKL